MITIVFALHRCPSLVRLETGTATELKACMIVPDHSMFEDIVPCLLQHLILYQGSLPKHSLKLLYTAPLSPYLHYCTVVWAGGHQNRLKSIHVLQKRTIRIIMWGPLFGWKRPIIYVFWSPQDHDIYKFQLAYTNVSTSYGNSPTPIQSLLCHSCAEWRHTAITLGINSIIDYEAARTNMRYFSVNIAGTGVDLSKILSGQTKIWVKGGKKW